MKKVLAFIFIIVVTFCIVGCGGNGGETGDNKDKGPTAVKITGKSQVKINETLQLSYTLTPATAKTTVTWESSNPSVATVDDKGLVYGASLGIAKITITTENGKTNTKVVQVKTELDPEYPDLGGYTIRIAHADNRKYEYDPFYNDGSVTYEGLDILEAQEAWEWVEENFNCHMEVVSYPSDATWPYLDYQLTQARNGVSNYDFLVMPDTKIPELVQGGAILDMTEWYDKYGQNLMDNYYISSGSYKGKLYSLTASEADVYNIMCYNVNLVNLVCQYDPSLAEPAKMFNDDNWDFDKFYEFSKKAQAVLDSLYPGEGYYVVCGWPIYYWIGMVNSSGIAVADVAGLQFNLTGDVETQAADLLKQMCAEGMVDPIFNVDGSVASWSQGKSIFNSGEYWFCNDSLRYPSDLWGDGDQTQYGYVPFPAATGTKKDQYKLAVTGGQTFVMPIAKDYTGYGDDCTAENIYWAMISYMIRAREKYRAREDYDENTVRETYAARLYSSAESIKANVYMNSRVNQIGFWDPMILESNPIQATYKSDWEISVRDYIGGTGNASTWAEAVEQYKSILEQSLARVYG